MGIHSEQRMTCWMDKMYIQEWIKLVLYFLSKVETNKTTSSACCEDGCQVSQDVNVIYYVTKHPRIHSKAMYRQRTVNT